MLGGDWDVIREFFLGSLVLVLVFEFLSEEVERGCLFFGFFEEFAGLTVDCSSVYFFLLLYLLSSILSSQNTHQLTNTPLKTTNIIRAPTKLLLLQELRNKSPTLHARKRRRERERRMY